MTAIEMALAEQLAVQMATALADFLSKKAAGSLTLADLHAVAAKTGADLNQLALDVAAL